jgi:DNA helicase TIP49 (TBP-interacting protein)
LKKGLGIQETKEIYDDEVTEVTTKEVEDRIETIWHVVVSVKMNKRTKKPKLDANINER